MDVVRQLSVDLSSVRMAIAVNTEKTTLTFGEGCRVMKHLNRSHNSGFGASQRLFHKLHMPHLVVNLRVFEMQPPIGTSWQSTGQCL